MKNPWKTLSSKEIYKDNFIQVRLDQVIGPDGKLGDYSVVELKGGIGVVALTENNEIYLVGQYRYAPDVYSWEIPKGAFTTFKSNENPLDIAKKELKEETGLVAEEWINLGKVYILMGSTDDVVYLFLAKKLTKGESKLEGTENIVTKTVSFKGILKLIRNNEITDATSIAAIYLAEKYLTKI